MEDKILEKGILEIAVENVQSLSHEEYALVRKNYFGASDSSILCGVNLYKSIEDLIKEKNCKFITQEEKEVGEKPIVKKGYDVEPITLQKAEEELAKHGFLGQLIKPQHMYKFKNVNGLSVNYDGVFVSDDKPLIPVEAKLVSKFGEKYYNKTITIEDAKQVNVIDTDIEIQTHIKQMASRLGIPAYYYTQVQQEIAGLDAPYGFLAAMFDETWTFKLYYIPRDEGTIQAIYRLCERDIKKVKRDV